MPDQSSAAQEHALLEQISGPLASLPEDPVADTADVEFPIALRGYDRIAVDAYVARTTQLIAELHATASPEGAIRRALERVGEEVAGVLQQAHQTANEVTTQSRSEAEDRLEAARVEAEQITAQARDKLRALDEDTDRIWAERDRIVGDARELAQQLIELAEGASAKFPAAEPEPMVALAPPEPLDAEDAGAATSAFDAAEPDGVAEADELGGDGGDEDPEHHQVFDVDNVEDEDATAVLWPHGSSDE
jgi:cell division septum initiation protein DivIVA